MTFLPSLIKYFKHCERHHLVITTYNRYFSVCCFSAEWFPYVYIFRSNKVHMLFGNKIKYSTNSVDFPVEIKYVEVF